MGSPVNIAKLNLSAHGLGIAVIVLLWTFVFLATLITLARLYTRKFVLKQLGHDDFWAAASILLFAVYAALSTVSVSKILDNPPGFSLGVIDKVFEAVKYLFIASIIFTLASFASKAVVILFLLRLVTIKWHRGILWFCLGANGFLVIITPILELARCHPMEKAWKVIVPGHCIINIRAYGIATLTWSAFVDFVLAILPWFTIWRLQMRRKERLLISLSLSLGVLAGITGIVRTYYAALTDGPTPLLEMCRVFIASGAEVFVTIVCAAIPTLRPLWLKVRGDKSALRYELNAQDSRSNYKRSEKRLVGGSCESQETVLPRQKMSSDERGVHVIKETTLTYEDDANSAQWHHYLQSSTNSAVHT